MRIPAHIQEYIPGVWKAWLRGTSWIESPDSISFSDLRPIREILDWAADKKADEVSFWVSEPDPLLDRPSQPSILAQQEAWLEQKNQTLLFELQEAKDAIIFWESQIQNLQEEAAGWERGETEDPSLFREIMSQARHNLNPAPFLQSAREFVIQVHTRSTELRDRALTRGDMIGSSFTNFYAYGESITSSASEHLTAAQDCLVVALEAKSRSEAALATLRAALHLGGAGLEVEGFVAPVTSIRPKPISSPPGQLARQTSGHSAKPQLRQPEPQQSPMPAVGSTPAGEGGIPKDPRRAARRRAADSYKGIIPETSSSDKTPDIISRMQESHTETKSLIEDPETAFSSQMFLSDKNRTLNVSESRIGNNSASGLRAQLARYQLSKLGVTQGSLRKITLRVMCSENPDAILALTKIIQEEHAQLSKDMLNSNIPKFTDNPFFFEADALDVAHQIPLQHADAMRVPIIRDYMQVVQESGHNIQTIYIAQVAGKRLSVEEVLERGTLAGQKTSVSTGAQIAPSIKGLVPEMVEIEIYLKNP